MLILKLSASLAAKHNSKLCDFKSWTRHFRTDCVGCSHMVKGFWRLALAIATGWRLGMVIYFVHR